MSEENKELTIQQKIDAIKDTPEMAALLNNHGKRYLESQEGELGKKYTGQAWNKLDTTMFEKTGIKKPDGVKTSDYLSSIALENTSLKEKLKTFEDKTNVEDTTIPDAQKELHLAEVAALKELLTTAGDLNTKLLTEKTEQTELRKFSKARQGKNYNPAFSQDVLNELLSSRTKQIVSLSKEVEGKTIYYKVDNSPYMNPNGLPMSAKEVSDLVFKDLYFTKTGGGDASDKPKVIDVKGDVLTIENANNIKTFAEYNKVFAKLMQSKGRTKRDKEYNKLQKATQEHYFPNGLATE